jgi:cytochrome P450
MSGLAVTALGQWRALAYLAAVISDPMAGTRRIHAGHRPYVTLALPFPFSRRSRPGLMGFIADVDLYRTVMSSPDIWRGVNIDFRGFRGNATQRLSSGMTRMRGASAAHYRALIGPPLKRPAVVALSPQMAAVADELVASWPRNVPTDLLPLTERLMQELAVSLLFGNDRARGMPIAKMLAWQSHAARLIPGREYLVWARMADRQERALLDWAEQKRGDVDAKDILSIIANNPDEKGAPPGPEIIGGLTGFIFRATFETCQNGLAWTLILLAQHPRIAGEVADEVVGALRGALPTIDRIGTLPLLDAVINEGLRLLPPVPIQIRKSMVATDLGGVAMKPGTRLLLSGHLINRNPDVYPDPDRFVPERWHELEVSAYDYTVFGAGGRMCPGSVFASQVAKTALAAILSRYRIDMVRDARIGYRNRITLSPYPRVPVILRDLAEPPVATRIAGAIHKLVRLPHAA